MANRERPLEAVGRLFGLKVSKESPFLKDKVNSFVRNKLFAVDEVQLTHRKAKYLKPGQETRIWNAVILNAIFSDPKDIQRIFEDKAFRLLAVNKAKALFGERQSVFGLVLQSGAVSQLLYGLETCSLDEVRLPNPFETLPQVALGKNSGLLYALLAQASALATEDALLEAYLTKNYKKALLYAEELNSNHPLLIQLSEDIHSRVREAEEFNDLLNYFEKH